MNPSAHTPGVGVEPVVENWRNDEGALLTMLEEVERKHGYIPQQVGDEVSRLLELKLERIKRAQAKLETGIRRDVQRHVARWSGEEGNLIMILHAIQNQYGYVPREVAMELSRELGVRLARIYEVITFYHYFKLQPPGKHNVTVCNGTACYLKGAAGLLAELRTQLGVGEGQTTPDREFHVDVVRCIGCCGMSPAVVCDGKTHGRVKPADIAGFLAAARATSPEAKP
ncbi:MAG TPA: NAD(P)H-dependent oxidoreductase subunit E [Opitutaceae bacterium]|nr:NAD(P)H-dependent oxidoreductase subunit E [Opitutaceae bacterium]